MFTMSRALVAVLSLVLGALATPQVSAQGSVTAYIGNDLAGLQSALKKDPSNLGLRMRVVRKLLDRVRNETTRASETRAIFRQLESEMAALIEKKPVFPYPYRVLARLYYRRGDFDKVLSLYATYEKIAPLDQEMRSLYTKSLLRLGTDEKNPAPARLKEAAEFVGQWFNSGDAPSLGKTLGVCSAWLREAGFRRELVATFEKQYRANPNNLNLVISYAAILSALGRNESAWGIVQKAEVMGLCDSITGARHPIAYLLEMDCPEVGGDASYAGMNVEELDARMKQHPNNVSFPIRAALVYKKRGDSATQLKALFEARARTLARENDPTKRDVITKCEDRAVEFGTEAKKNFGRALPYAKKAFELNPSIESTSLLLGDISFKLENFADAETYFRKGVDLVPQFVELREGLARVYQKRKDWPKAAAELAEICAVLPCDAAEWNDKAEDSILPVPSTSFERLLAELAKDPSARNALAQGIEKLIREKPGNPNLPTHLAAVHYFGGNRTQAVRWMQAAEKAGICGVEGYMHELAGFILERENW